jgi:hypothetical protein
MKSLFEKRNKKNSFKIAEKMDKTLKKDSKVQANNEFSLNGINYIYRNDKKKRMIRYVDPIEHQE